MRLGSVEDVSIVSIESKLLCGCCWGDFWSGLIGPVWRGNREFMETLRYDCLFHDPLDIGGCNMVVGDCSFVSQVADTSWFGGFSAYVFRVRISSSSLAKLSELESNDSTSLVTKPLDTKAHN